MRMLDLVERMERRAANAIDGGEGTPAFIEQMCTNGGMFRLDILADDAGTKSGFWGCAEPEYTLDGCIEKSHGRTEGQMHVASSSVSGDCGIDYELVLLENINFIAADGTVCGYDWVDDVFCPPGRTEPNDRICPQLRMQTR